MDTPWSQISIIMSVGQVKKGASKADFSHETFDQLNGGKRYETFSQLNGGW